MLCFLLDKRPAAICPNGFLSYPPHQAISMEKLNEYLQALLSSCSEELHLQPEIKPYLVSGNSTREIANIPILGTQISMMVFPLIPPDVKAALPHNSEVEFIYVQDLGKFNFVVQKSPAGFNVTIRPLMGEAVSSPDYNPLPATPPTVPATNVPFLTVDPEPGEAAPQYQLEHVSSGIEYNSEILVSQTNASKLVPEPAEELFDLGTLSSSPGIDVVPANDPQFVTTFSPTAEFDPRPSEYPHNSDEYILPSLAGNTPVFDLPAEAAPQAQPLVAVPASLESLSKPSAAQPTSGMKARMDALFHAMSAVGASDLHMSVSMPPMIRKDGRMTILESNESVLTADSIRELLTSIIPAKNQQEFAERHDTDFAYEIVGLARFRCNVFMDRKGMGAVFRIIPSKILTAEQLGLSKAIMDLCNLSKGLVVVTGPTGSGKSTTLCSMVDWINKNREEHIITIEDPIEFVHENQKCLINQREVHNHTDGFKPALRAALREDPDIVLVGEMRDLETISIAIETAETGHLVFGTLHTTTAASTVDRIIDQFPADRQQQIRVMLSESLKGVIAQTLLPKKGGGRVAALEVLIVTPAISNLIREGKTFQIPSAMQTGKAHGMVMLNDALFEHVKSGTVDAGNAHKKAVDKGSFETMLTRAGLTFS
jgi:twitching motility protein PilT